MHIVENRTAKFFTASRNFGPGISVFVAHWWSRIAKISWPQFLLGLIFSFRGPLVVYDLEFFLASAGFEPRFFLLWPLTGDIFFFVAQDAYRLNVFGPFVLL